jgi:predicted transcriptional regulator
VEQKNLTTLNILNAITFGRDLFYSIASKTYHDDTINSNVTLSRKRYYNALTRFIKLDLIKRKSGSYFLTPFGEVIYQTQLSFREAVDDHLKTKILTPPISLIE